MEHDLEYGGFWRRFLASLIDGIVISLIYTPIEMVFGTIYYGSFQAYWIFSQDNQFPYNPYTTWTNLITLVISAIYYIVMTSSNLQATIGKKILKMKVVNDQGERISKGKALVRFIGYFISALPLFLGYIIAAFTRKKRALHDFIAKTYVVKTGKQQT